MARPATDFPKVKDMGDRLMWLVQHTPVHPEAPIITDLNTLEQALNFVLESVFRVKRGELPSDTTYDRYFKGITGLQPRMLSALGELLPFLDQEALKAPTFEEFERTMGRLVGQYAVWVEVTNVIATKRRRLEQEAKRYYQDIDATPLFPLVTAPGWLLDQPQELKEEDEPPVFRSDIPDFEAAKLAENFFYHDVKRHFMQNERLRQHRESMGKRNDGDPIKPLRVNLFNGRTYRVLDVMARNDRLEFQFSEGGYYNYIDTCEFRAAELADRTLGHYQLSTDALPVRGAPKEIFTFTNRSAPLGVNCLLLLKNYDGDGQHRFALHERDTSTAEAQNTTHVVPAGGHAPVSRADDARERGLWWTVAREFVEELFNKEEAAGIKQTSPEFLENPQVKPYVDIFFRDPAVARAFLLGVGLDPLTTKPEALVAVVVDWARAQRNWRERYPDDAKVPPPALKLEANYEGTIVLPELNRERLISEAEKVSPERSVLPAAAACLLRAADPQRFAFLLQAV